MSSDASCSASCQAGVQNQAWVASTSFRGRNRIPPAVITTSTESPSPRCAARRMPEGMVTCPLSLITATAALRCFIGISDIQNIGLPARLSNGTPSAREVNEDEAPDDVHAGEAVADQGSAVHGAALGGEDVENRLPDQVAAAAQGGRGGTPPHPDEKDGAGNQHLEQLQRGVNRQPSAPTPRSAEDARNLGAGTL